MAFRLRTLVAVCLFLGIAIAIARLGFEVSSGLADINAAFIVWFIAWAMVIIVARMLVT